MTHRQFRVWQLWRLEERNYPSRSDYYLMQIAAEVRRPNVKNPRKVSSDHFRLRFSSRVVKKTVSKEEMKSKIAASKAAWIGVLGSPKG